jgi:hypothetical protein
MSDHSKLQVDYEATCFAFLCKTLVIIQIAECSGELVSTAPHAEVSGSGLGRRTVLLAEVNYDIPHPEFTNP